MPYPLFLDIAPSCPDEQMYPTEIAWSLTDGQIKSTLILPDDDWEPWDHIDHDTDVQLLMDQGASAMDVVRELNADLDGETVFVDGLDNDPLLIERLFEACGEEPSFEIASIGELFLSHAYEQLLHARNEIANEYGLDIRHPEDAVRSLLQLNARVSTDDL